MPEPVQATGRLPVLTLYTRQGCHLCEQAAEQLTRLDFRFEPVDIDADADLKQRYGHDVPVLALGGQTLLKGVLSPARLSALKLRLLRENPAR
ncbi:glutaredoxin family protein [Deinococcus aerophilus]|uniref:NrdH-redoxin n=1 Tax=Deinococcus aerophilus TaxID=522488 RepID=A0ABQ2GSD2_9DEIO|nr:glutaredoxin family protein [Deinococcus aerophilus]GGM10946.1 NrdH-redoxin [Deinococcus aerophilus]